MATMKDYDTMDVAEQGKVLSDALSDLVQRMYYGNKEDELIELAKNLGEIQHLARNCIECLDMLLRGGDMYEKICLFLDYMGKNGLSERFVNGLVEVSERAQEVYAETHGGTMTAEEQQEVLRRLSNIMERNEELALGECEIAEAE